jgi:hypothetical protein
MFFDKEPLKSPYLLAILMASVKELFSFYLIYRPSGASAADSRATFTLNNPFVQLSSARLRPHPGLERSRRISCRVFSAR